LGSDIQIGALSSGTAAISLLCAKAKYQVSCLQTSWKRYGWRGSILRETIFL